ncbi:MAG TPA: alpha/beta hydrolase [Devosia sp.]|nr:alpha/beta hydrolase [Devosia sp.]
MRIFWRILVGLVVVAVLVYVGALAALYFMQRDFQYDPEDKVTELSQTKLVGTEAVVIPTANNQTVTGWYQAPQPGKPLIVYYKGNYGTFSGEHERYEAWTADGYGFVAFDYRGFLTSPGTITETNMLADSIAVFDWAQAKGFPIVLWGRSVGSGPSAYVASKKEADALYLETPYDSAVAVGQERYWFFPIGLLMLDQFRLDLWIKDVTEPTFVAVATDDKTVPVGHGRHAYELVPNKAGFWEQPNAGHSDLWKNGEWVDHARPFFESVEKSLGR